MMERHIKNQFCELQAECSEMWNERKGMDHTNNKRQIQSHFNRVKKHMENIKAIITKIETEEYALINDLYLK